MPWIRKTKSMIQSENARRRWSPWPAVMCFVLFFFVGLISYARGPKWGRHWPDMTFPEAVIDPLVIATIGSVASYIFQIVFGFPMFAADSDNKVDICPECLTAMPRGNRKCQCQCGVEPIEGWTFKDDEE